jgi:hypothetical protein
MNEIHAHQSGGGMWKIIAVLCFFLVLGMVLAWYISTHEAEFTRWLETLGAIVLGALIVFGVALVIALGGALYVRLQAARLRLLQARRQAEIQTIIAGADEQVYLADEGHRTWRALSHDPRVYGNGEWTEPTVTEAAAYLAWVQRRAKLDMANPLLLPMAEAMPDLLTELTDAERALIVGSSGSGKTTLLQHLAAGRGGRVVVIDPHDDRHTWPDNAQVIGGGQDYAAITDALYGLAALVKERYALRYAGQLDGQPPITVVCDEWREITQHAPSTPDYFKGILTGGRKVLMSIIIGSHSDRAEPLGLKGEADLKDGLVIVRLKGDRLRGFSATLDKGDGERAVSLPGPYRPGVAAPVKPLELARPGLPDDERRVLEMHAAGESITAIGAAVYGDGTKGGQQNALVRSVLQKHGQV